MRKFIVCAVFMLAGAAMFAAEANVWYVDDDNYNASGDGTSAEKAFGSLQEANDNANVKDGDIIKVLPGVYNQGAGTVHAENSRLSRLVVTKRLRFEAVGGKDSAHIVGVLSSAAEKYGPDGMRCVYVASTAKGTQFHKFTFRDGSANGSNGSGGHAEGKGDADGGGICVYGVQSREKNSAAFAGAFIVDCVVSNCYGRWSGAIRGGTSIRTLFKNCGGHTFGQVAGAAALWCCVIDGATAGDKARPVVANRSRAVNCTINGYGGHSMCGQAAAFNTVFCNGSAICTEKFGVYEITTYENCYDKNSDPYPLFAPALGDFRLRAGTPAASGGKTSYLTDEIILPDDTEMKDFYGNPIDTGKETCHAGAVQTVATPVCGRLDIGAGYTADGNYVAHNSYAFSETFPRTLEVRQDNVDSDEIFRLRIGGLNGWSVFRYFEYDGSVQVSFPPMPGDYTTFSTDYTGVKIWVDDDAVAAGADGSEEKPFRTIQAAMDYISANNPSGNILVKVMPGHYNEGSRDFNGHGNRVVLPDRAMLIKAVDGPENTVIYGKADESTLDDDAYPGCGSGAMRCVSVESSTGSNRAMQGFTFTDGFSNKADYKSTPDSDAGGGFNIGSFANIQILDSVITNCAAVRCGASRGGSFYRCRFYDCHGYGGVFRDALLSSCLVDSSCTLGAAPADASKNCILGNCTITCHVTAPGADIFVANQYPSYLWAIGGLGFARMPENLHMWGSVATSADDRVNKEIGGRFARICYADAANGDYRLVGNSPVCNLELEKPEAGTVEYGLWATNYAAYVTSSLDGRKIAAKNGKVLAGAYQNTDAGAYIAADNGGIIVSGGAIGSNKEGSWRELAISAGSGSRPVAGVVVNGSTNLFAETGNVVLNSSDAAVSGGWFVEAVYSPHWYVNPDPEIGSDDNNGFSAVTPKLTLSGVMTAGVKAGDTVHAAPGRYDRLTMPSGNDGGIFVRARVSVPAGAKLVSEAGAESTFIVGADDTSISGDANGMGTNAVRAVYLNKNATIAGFTVCGGRTCYTDGSDYNIKTANYKGGGIFGAADWGAFDDCRAYDCIISNNYAVRGGGIYSVSAIRCRLFYNHGMNGGGAAHGASLYGSVVDYSYSGSSSGQAGCYEMHRVYSSTLGAHNRNFADALSNCALHMILREGMVANTLVLGNLNGYGNWIHSPNNCVFAGTKVGTSAWEGPSCVSVNSVEIDEDLRPILAEGNVLIDSGNSEYLTLQGSECDILGSQRVMNGAVDIGAVEADWKGRYAADITGKKLQRHLAVAAASPNVVETAEANVRINPAGSLDIEWVGADLKRELSFKVVGGTLTVKVNGDTYSYSSSSEPQRMVFESAGDIDRLELSFAASDGVENAFAEILKARNMAGLSLRMR